jgi:hypothetical protein
MDFTTPIRLEIPTAPTAGNTATLFDSTVSFPGLGISGTGCHRIRLAFPGLDEDIILTGYVSQNSGTDWDIDTFEANDVPGGMPLTVSAQDSSGFMWYDISVRAFPDVRLTVTAGGTAPTVWRPIIMLEPDPTPIIG